MPNLRNPAPEAPVRTYPTPDITDQVLVEWVTSEEAFSRPLVPGTPHANTRDFSGFKLGKQDVNPRDNHWFIRYWVIDQPDPDFYNYAIKFAQESNLHPIIIRSYRELKNGYTARLKGSQDPNFEGAFLVSEEAKQFEPTSEFYANYFNVVRVYETLPGPYIPETKLSDDGVTTISTRKNKTSDVAPDGEIVVPGIPTAIWQQQTHKGLDNFTSEERIEALPVPGDTIPSAKVENDLFVTTTETTLREVGDIIPGAAIAGGVITTIDHAPVSELVGHEVLSRKPLFPEPSSSTSIKQVIPDEFLRVLPTYTFSRRLQGAITEPPVLALGELTRKEDQLDALTFRRSTESLPVATLPITITNYELTERYGGGFLTVTLTLDTTIMTPDEGYLVVESFVREMHAPDPPAYPTGLYMKLSKRLAPPATQWPLLSSRLWDESMRVEYDETTQVLPAGTAESPNPGGSVFAWSSEVKAIDKWRSRRINISKPEPNYVDEASALISYEFQPYTFPGLLTPTGFGYYVRTSYAKLIKHIIRTWWEISVGTPTVAVEEIIQDNVIISTLNDTSTLAYSGQVLHDALTTFGTLFWPATTPDYTTYTTSWLGFEKVIALKVVPEREKDLWKIETRAVIMR
jgi:hypothetical protein